jgi:hypothetical protein
MTFVCIRSWNEINVYIKLSYQPIIAYSKVYIIHILWIQQPLFIGYPLRDEITESHFYYRLRSLISGGSS